MTHDTRTLQSHDLSGEGINSGSHTYFFDHTRTWRASPDEGAAQCQGYLRENIVSTKDFEIITNNKAGEATIRT